MMNGAFICYARIDCQKGWEETEAKLLRTLGKRASCWKLGGGMCQYWWYVDSIQTAAVMAEAARQIPNVVALAREPLAGE